MKQVFFTTLVFASILLSTSCNKESSTIANSDPEGLEGTWFRSYPNKVWGGHDRPSFERGEAHIRITFQENGDFIYNRTILGLYEGTTINDTTAIVIESGTYSAEEKTIDINLNKRIWWDSFHEDMVGFEESGVDPNKFTDVTYEIVDEELNLVYFTATDIVSDDQERFGFDKFDEVYVRE